MSLEKYHNADPYRISETGGCFVTTLTGTDSTQLADHPCRRMLIAAGNADDVQFSIGADVSTANFAYLPQLSKNTGDPLGDRYLELTLTSTDKVYVKGETGDKIYCIYFE